MKKLLALVMALIMAVCMFSACSGENNGNVETNSAISSEAPVTTGEKPANDEEVIDKTFGEFLGCLFGGDEKAYDYVLKDSVAYSGVEGVLKTFEVFDSFAEDNGIPASYAAEVNGLVADFADSLFEKVEYEISDIKVDGNKATANVKLKSPDFDSMGNFEELVDAESLLLESFTMDELSVLIEGTEEEQGKLMVKFFKILFDAAIEEFSKTSTETESSIEFEKIGEKWIITNIDEDIL